MPSPRHTLAGGTAALGVAAAGAWALPAAAPHAPPIGAAFGIARRAALHDAVALTFDDGPHPQGTPAVLATLARFGATATFFVVGEQVRRTGTLLDEIAQAGHGIAIHGDTHRCLLRLAPRTVADDLDRARATIGDRAALAALHRAPYGTYTTAALRAVRARGWRPPLWSRWGRDWHAQRDPRRIAAGVTRGTRAGDVLLLHDADDYSEPGSWRATAAALPLVLERLEERGLRAQAITADQLACGR